MRNSWQQCLTRGIQELETLTHCFPYSLPQMPNDGPDLQLDSAHEPQVQHFKGWQKHFKSDEPSKQNLFFSFFSGFGFFCFVLFWFFCLQQPMSHIEILYMMECSVAQIWIDSSLIKSVKMFLSPCPIFVNNLHATYYLLQYNYTKLFKEECILEPNLKESKTDWNLRSGLQVTIAISFRTGDEYKIIKKGVTMEKISSDQSTKSRVLLSVILKNEESSSI